MSKDIPLPIEENKSKIIISKMWIVVAIIIILIIVGTMYNPPAQEPTPNQIQLPITDLIGIDDDTIKGDPEAPVTIIEFSDYECAFCRRHFAQTMPYIQDYIDRGEVRYIFRDYVMSYHQRAIPAAEAAECAGIQNKYFDMHDMLFSGELDDESIQSYAEEIGLNMELFNQCLEEDIMLDEIKKDLQDGRKAGITGTPGFSINGVLVKGAQPFEVFKQIIEGELNK